MKRDASCENEPTFGNVAPRLLNSSNGVDECAIHIELRHKSGGIRNEYGGRVVI